LEVDLRNVTQDSQTQLVEAAVAGDIGSFGELAGQFYPAMVAIGYSILADNQLAEDAAQEALARALANLRNLKNRKKFAPWLAAICRNVAKDMVAARARQIGTDDLSQEAENRSADDNIHAVRLAVDKLPASAKEIIILRYYDGLSYEEISAVLGVSRPAINGRLTRAKRKLARRLQQNGVWGSRL